MFSDPAHEWTPAVMFDRVFARFATLEHAFVASTHAFLQPLMSVPAIPQRFETAA